MPPRENCGVCKAAFTSVSLAFCGALSFSMMALIIVITAHESSPGLMVAGILGSVFTGISGIASALVFVASVVMGVIYCSAKGMNRLCLARWRIVFGIAVALFCIPGIVFGILMYLQYQGTFFGLALGCFILGIHLGVAFLFWVLYVLCICTFVQYNYEEMDDEEDSADSDAEEERPRRSMVLCCCAKKKGGVFRHS